ncbi:MAG: hypothetical protein JWQ29_954 [Phenylobacterium sp.]|nr:hypothetical protein [Phenylobacterium sp.]
MTHGLARPVPFKRPAGRWIGWSAMALFALLLALAPQMSHAATFSAKDADAIGKWGPDVKEDPTRHYEVVAGPRPGQLQLISPAVLKIPPIALHRVAANAFASAPGTAPTASLTLTDARHARLKVNENSKKRLAFTYLLLDKQ